MFEQIRHCSIIVWICFQKEMNFGLIALKKSKKYTLSGLHANGPNLTGLWCISLFQHLRTVAHCQPVRQLHESRCNYLRSACVHTVGVQRSCHCSYAQASLLESWLQQDAPRLLPHATLPRQHRLQVCRDHIPYGVCYAVRQLFESPLLHLLVRVYYFVAGPDIVHSRHVSVYMTERV